VLATVERFLRETRGPLAAHQRKVKVPPGATVEGQRAALRELAADLHEVRSAPVPSSAVKARIREQVDALAERGCPNVHHILEGSDAGILWNMLTLRANINGHAATEGMPAVVGIAQTSTPDAFALLAWLAKDALIARLEAEVDEQSDDAAALGDDERAEKEDALLQRMLECERIEELLCEAEGAERRPDGDARAVLGIAE
jgi:hypothetical protein